MNPIDTSDPPIPPGATLYRLEPHSFSDEAARHIQTHCNDTIDGHCSRIEEVWDAVLKPQNANAYGLIPFENSTGGVVWPNLDRLDREHVQITGETKHQVCMCVGGNFAVDLEKVTHIHSHGKGLEQCRRFISSLKHLREEVRADTTVKAVRDVAELHVRSHVALGSRSAIESMKEDGMRVLAADVADLKGADNITQMFIIHQNGHGDDLPAPEKKYHAAILTAENVVGGLNRVLSIIANARVNLYSVHSRPIGMKDYKFFVEMERAGKPEEFELMAKQLPHNMPYLKWLGSWNHQFSS